MRSFLAGAVFVLALAYSAPAFAQFQNHSIGFEVGYIHLQKDVGYNDALVPPAFALNATVYMEHGFDVGLRFGLAIQKNPSDTQVVLLYPAAELRYFIQEDYLRPYIGANVEFIHAFGDDTGAASTNFVGLAPVLGVEYSVSPDWSVGVAGEVPGYFALNAGAHYAIQVWARVATQF